MWLRQVGKLTSFLTKGCDTHWRCGGKTEEEDTDSKNEGEITISLEHPPTPIRRLTRLTETQTNAVRLYWKAKLRGVRVCVCHFHWKTWGQLVLFCFCRKSWLYSAVSLTLLAASRSCCVQFSAAVRRNNSELHNTEKKELFATCAAPVPRYTRHDLPSLGTAAAPPPFLCPPGDHSLPLPPRWSQSRHCEKRAQKATPIEKRREEWAEKDQSDRRFSWSISIRFFQLSNQPAELDFYHQSVQLFSFTLTSVNTLLPYHFPLHPVTVTTSQPPSSALRCVPLTDSCFTFPLVLLQPKTHSLSTRSVGTSRRRSDISTSIQDNNIDMMLLTETWLRPAGDEAAKICRGVRCKSRGHRVGVLILVRMEILWEEEGFQFGFKRWQCLRSCGSEF